MTELELQKKILKQLEKNWKKAKINEESAYLSGTSDIAIIDKKNKKYSIEIKLKPNSALINQLKKQVLYSHYLIAITFKPKNKSTCDKWNNIAKENNINLFYVINTERKIIKKWRLKKNPKFSLAFNKGLVFND